MDGRRVRAMLNPWSTALTGWWCHSAARFALTGHGRRADGRRRRDVVWLPAERIPHAVRIEPLKLHHDDPGKSGQRRSLLR
jgi:hypothetical protein